MENYIQQLIADLEAVAANDIKTTYYEIPPHLTEIPDIAELAQVEFKPISEWTGIESEVFPEVELLSENQILQLNYSIRKVLNKLNVEIIDLPENLPEENFYTAITTNWDSPIQYLPLSGFDMELCEGEMLTCPYGIYCQCSEYIKAYQIPDYLEIPIIQVAKLIDSGKYCSLNINTGEITEIENKSDYINMVVFPKPDYIYYKPISEEEEILFIKFYAEIEEDDKIAMEIEKIMEGENIIENFRNLVNKYALKNEWEQHRKNMPETIVREKLLEYWEYKDKGLLDINDLYDDNGNKIDTENIKVPALCMGCKSFYTEDAEENLLCMMNRSDQSGEKEFRCEAYKNI